MKSTSIVHLWVTQIFRFSLMCQSMLDSHWEWLWQVSTVSISLMYVLISLSVSPSHTCMHARTHTHARMHARTHTRTHSSYCLYVPFPSQYSCILTYVHAYTYTYIHNNINCTNCIHEWFPLFSTSSTCRHSGACHDCC